jgi:serine protease inhibitor
VIILNAIYFKGQWEQKFDKRATEKKPFTLLSGKVINVPTMVLYCFIHSNSLASFLFCFFLTLRVFSGNK